MEIFDIVDENGKPTGQTVDRETAHREGICHRTAHIWILKKENNRVYVLLQKRALIKDSFPGRYDTSSAGHIHAGDEPIESAVRELYEELGIKAEVSDFTYAGNFRVKYEKEFHGKLFKDNEVAFVYLYSEAIDIDTLTLQEEEVEAVEWFEINYTLEECLKHNQKFCVPVDGLKTVIKYLEENNAYNICTL